MAIRTRFGPAALREVVIQTLTPISIPAEPAVLDRLEIHLRLLVEWNSVAGLVSEADSKSLRLARHYVESILALPHLGDTGEIVDIGSGGGFPALIWASFMPSRRITLIEADKKKAAFLREARRCMRLDLVDVLRERLERAERIAQVGADIVSTRAAASGPILLSPAVQSSGRPLRILIYAGATDSERIMASAAAMNLTLKATVPLAVGRPGGELLVFTRS